MARKYVQAESIAALHSSGYWLLHGVTVDIHEDEWCSYKLTHDELQTFANTHPGSNSCERQAGETWGDGMLPDGSLLHYASSTVDVDSNAWSRPHCAADGAGIPKKVFTRKR